MTQMEKLQQHLSCTVKKSLLLATVVILYLLKFDKLIQDQVIHGFQPMSFTEYFDILLCAVQQAVQDGYENGQQCQLKHVVHDCELIQDGCETLFLSPRTTVMTLNKIDVQDIVIKKSTQMKFSDWIALSVLLQV